MNNNRNDFFVVCVVGQPGSGKDTIANFLEKEKGFYHISTGNIIREEMRKKGIPVDRENMRIFSAKMRKKIGNSYPASIAVGKIVGNTVISGPRNFAEVEVFKNKFGKNFILVAVDALVEIRYERIKNGRGRIGDDISLEEFKRQEEAECNSSSHGLTKLLSQADYHIVNHGTVNHLLNGMDKMMDKILKLIKK